MKLGPLFIIIYLFNLCAFPLFGQTTTPVMQEDPSSIQEDPSFTVWNPRVPKNNEKPIVSECKIIKKKPSYTFYPSGLTIGASYSYIHETPKEKASDHGYLYGLQALYQYVTPDFLYAGASVSWRQGLTRSATGTRFLNVIDAQERLGYTWGSLKKKRFFSLFTGLGYRHNAEHVKASPNSARFFYNDLYVPVGIIFSGKISSIFSAGTNIVWMPQVYPSVKISPLKGARWIVINKLANFRIDLPLTFKFYKESEFALQLNPYFEYWQNGHTDAKSQQGVKLIVPENTYLYGGFEFSLRYSF